MKALLLLALVCGSATAQLKHPPIWADHNGTRVEWFIDMEGARMEPSDESSIAVVEAYRGGQLWYRNIVAASGCKYGMGTLTNMTGDGSQFKAIWTNKGTMVNDALGRHVCNSGYINSMAKTPQRKFNY
jgi:hypothetical protein